MKIFVGLDVAKEVHWVAAIDGNAKPLLSHAVENEHGQIAAMLDEISVLRANFKCAA